MEIKNVIICGLGALGLTYANKLNDVCELKILADAERIEKYKKNPPKMNGKCMELNYITPSDSFSADLVIIATKASGLDSAIKYFRNFVGENTIIISLINGISSEEKIATYYKNARVLRSYYIGHSAIRTNNNVTQDGAGKIVIEPSQRLEDFFKSANICYEVSKDIIYSQWVKLGVNIILNEPSALYELTVGELRKKEGYKQLAQVLLEEVKLVAQRHGLKNLNNYIKDVYDSANLVSDDSKTSMYQDVIAGRKTEVEIFSGEIIRLGELYNIATPSNKKIYYQIIEKTSHY